MRGNYIFTGRFQARSVRSRGLKQPGFNKLVILSESPYHNAIQIVNPGQTDIPRVMAKSYVTPPMEKWPTDYETEDIIIKEIP